MSKKILVNLVLTLAMLLPLGLSVASAAPPAQGELTYTVKLGDNLWTLAEKYLGSGPAYWAIVGASNAKYEEDASYLEGSYYEAENDYIVYVYLTTNTSRYDRLIAYQILNSIKK